MLERSRQRQVAGLWLVALLALAMWRYTGVNVLYFLAGMQSIPDEYYEAASIDGASRVQQFFQITLPNLKPTIVYVTTISIYGGLAMFLESFMLYAGNSSPNNQALTVVGYLYRRGIEENDLGFASAVGVVPAAGGEAHDQGRDQAGRQKWTGGSDAAEPGPSGQTGKGHRSLR